MACHRRACHQQPDRASWSRSRQHVGSVIMVPRYSRPEMDAIWAPENRYRIWFEIEALAAEGMARFGLIPATAAQAIREKGGAQVAADQRRRCGADRCDRARDAPRRDCVPDLACRGDRPGQPLRPPGHDQHRRAGHLPVGAAHPGDRPAAGGPRSRAGGAEDAGVRAQAHADHRAQPRHPRRADHVRPEARRPLRRVRPRSCPAGGGAGGNRGGGDLAARSAPSRISIRGWRLTSPSGWGWPSSRCRPR